MSDILQNAQIAGLASELEVQAKEARELRALLLGFLNCPEISECAPEDKDVETERLEREARTLLGLWFD